MRLGKSLKNERVYQLPARDGFDIVGTSDVSSFRTALEGVNPFDVSPGIKLILDKMEERPKSSNPYVIYTNELNFDVAQLSTTTDENGNSYLHVAAAEGYVDLVPILVKEGCEIDAYNGQGFTPLHLAAQNGRLQTVKLLKDLGANMFLLTKALGEYNDNRSAIFLAHMGNHSTVEEYLMKLHELSFPVLSAVAAQPTCDALFSALLGNETHFFELFDTMDSTLSGSGPLVLTWSRHASAFNRFSQLGSCLVRHLESTSDALTAQQSTVLSGFITRGAFEEDDDHLIALIATKRAAEALRAYFSVHRYAESTIDKIKEASREDSAVFLLLSELENRLLYLSAVEKYARKGSKGNKGRIDAAKHSHEESLSELETKGLRRL
ncbi:hypothetical protein AGDE_07434 [Angomonas deanei]|uniref:Ankyrin repeats (Many copies)/Ankyrin repeats (3 copies)/Ankyrin repeat, putative n=1 Tax=Angomonas deanei TaxID=59799 RepID=A0A7G2CFQ9_9TRYP|nr:hypothetical protein AGDE_07434 [Angomonas deanei]CAD2217857.1 Ankyrin repeats (many copies)/Ankyrin repeats (3 copies)/Ankyrin repeat, putative [Angomonas deanei]|eukprot:EPY35350.1 hypothetical protein AGDE_07434 [Angomonas deanei]